MNEREPARRTGLGPIVMLVPALSLALAVVFLRGRLPENQPTPPPPAGLVEREIVGLSGLHERDGLRVSLRLTRLHTSAERQRFDAAALRDRLQRDAGEPWRLTLRRLDAGAAGTALTFDSMRVVDARGTALETLTTDMPEAGVHDPLRVLLAPGAVTLGPRQSLEVVLWGREPGQTALLLGLAPDGGDAQGVELTRTSFRSGAIEEPLARLEVPGEEPR